MTKALLLCFIVLRLCCGNLANAAVVSFPTCSAADVQTAFNAVRAGDRIVGPTQGAPAIGTAKWTTQVKFSVPENVVVQVACNITDNYKPSADKFHTAGPVLAMSIPTNGKVRFTGFQIKADAANSNYKSALIAIYGMNKQFRADHLRCDTTSGAYPDLNYAVVTCFEFFGQVNGVIDHSEFNFGDRGGVFIIHGDGEGDAAWAKPGGFGGSDFLFFEDNKITNLGSGGTVNDCYHGGKWVIRYNDIQGASIGQTHPTGGSGRARGCRAWEAYKNRFTVGVRGDSNFNAFFLSSGSGVIWGHEGPAAYKNWMTLHSMRVPPSNPYNQQPVPQGWGFFPSAYDQTNSGFDQPGKGKSDLLADAFPSVRNVTKGCRISETCKPDQIVEGVYEWDNVWANPLMGGSKIAVYEGNMVAGRDYFPDTKMPAYTPYAYPHPLTLDTNPPPVPAVAASTAAARSPAPPSAPSTVSTPSPAPVDPCVAVPLKITGVKWPAEQTGNRSLSWDSASHKLSRVEFTWPGTAVFTDIRGCAVTVKK